MPKGEYKKKEKINMQNKLFAIMITALLVMLMAGSAMCATYDSSVELVEKDSEWQQVGGGAIVTVEYNASGETFDWRVTGTTPHAGEYCLIYYADKPNRFDEWGGDNPGALICTVKTNNNRFIENNQNCPNSGSTELEMNLPCCPDANMDISEHDYCGAPDYYDNCTGAKLWMVPSSDYTEPAMTAWDPARYLFETDLIWYDDTDLAPEIIEYDMDHCVQAGDTVQIEVVVEDMDGIDDLENMIVTANMSEYGVEDIVTLELDQILDCTSANYTVTVTVTKTTTHCCDNCNGDTEFPIHAKDPSELNDTLDAHLDVEPGEAHRLVIDGPDEVLSLTYGCIDLDIWDYTNPEYYAAIMTVILVDEYGNQVYDTGCAMDVTAEAYVSHISGSGGYMEAWTGFIAAGDLFSQPCTSTFTVRCLNDPKIGWGYHTVEFLPSVYELDVTLENSMMYYDNGSVDCTTVYGQLVDDTGNPISMPGVLVEFYHGDGDSGKVYIADPYSETDENGIANTTVCIVTDIACTANIYAEAECRAGYTVMDIVEPVLYCVEIVDTWSPMTSGENQTFVYTCSTDHDTLMCCPDGGIWSATLGEINETTGYFTAGEYAGIAVVEVNVSGVVGTAEIVVDGEKTCNTTVVAGAPFTVTSSGVSISGNFTDDGGFACLKALGDPIPEWDNVTRGADVTVSENVTLNITGDGDIWMFVDGNWSKYADGSEAEEVGNGTYALVEPAPDPVPEPTPTATTKRSSRGGGGGGIYPPDPTPTPDADNATDNETDQDDPKPATAKTADAKPTVNLPGGDPLDTTPDETEDEAPGGADPTSAILIVLGIMALIVIGYVLYRKSQQ